MGRGRLVVVAGCVEPDDGVVVDDAAGLVFGDFDEPDSDLGAQVLVRDSGQAGELAGQVDGEPAPQLGGGGGEGGEHARMPGDGLGDALAAGQAGTDDLLGVLLVDAGAGRADVLAAVAAGDQQDLAGFSVGVVHGAGLAGGAVDGVDAALEADRAGAVAGGGELMFPAVEVLAGGEFDEVSG